MRSSTNRKLMGMFDLMLGYFGPQRWWPGESELEMMVGAILTQNTSWSNVEKAINKLKANKLLSLENLYSISLPDLAENIRSAGYFNIKAKRLRNLINFLVEKYKGDMELFLGEETDKLREGLLSVNGVGPETADSILLYAAKRPIFVIDAYTHRILDRHKMANDEASYHDLQELFMDNLPEDTKLFNEFHALIVRTGKELCRKKPLCNICPLEKCE